MFLMSLFDCQSYKLKTASFVIKEIEFINKDGKKMKFTLNQLNQECDLVVNCDEFGLEDFSGKDIHDLIYS